MAASSGVFHRGPSGPTSPTVSAIPAAYDADRAYGYLTQLCDIGPRPSGSAGMKQQQELLQTFFRDQGAEVTFQTFEIRHPEDGSNVPMANLIASWRPKAPKRFLVCAHYDTRPYPDQDPHNRRGRFIGANDGASGTAGLMELAHQMSDMPDDVGVDLVAFDGEEFVWQQGRDDYFLGSTFFAEKYVAQPPAVPYQAGILLDMIGDRELKIYYEMNSMKYAPKVAASIWQTARKLGVRAFVSRTRHKIEDDHIPLNEIARIPTVDLIDFDFPRPGIGAPSYWHTEQDVPENCSGESIAAVVWVVHQWLKNQ
ncbi:MAG: M28 family peptidase [Pirellulaceae bacterium]|nr:M28 family peptidase [Pirellulaceae bacterium]